MIIFRRMKVDESCHCGGENSPANLLKCNGKSSALSARHEKWR